MEILSERPLESKQTYKEQETFLSTNTTKASLDGNTLNLVKKKELRGSSHIYINGFFFLPSIGNL